MKTQILIAITGIALLMAVTAYAHDEQPSNAEVQAQLNRIEQAARVEAVRARQRAFRERAAQDAQRHHQRGMCAVNGTC